MVETVGDIGLWFHDKFPEKGITSKWYITELL